MGYIVNASQLRELGNALSAACKGWHDALKGTVSAVENLAQSEHIAGSGAETVSEYLSHVHATCIGYPLLNLIAMLPMCYNEYRAKYTELDGACDALIDTDQLEALVKATSKLVNQLQKNVESPMNTVISGISDISEATYDGLQESMLEAVEQLKTFLTTLSNNIGQIEADGPAQLNNFHSGVEAVRNIVNRYNQASFSALKYSSSDLANSSEFNALCTAMGSVSTQIKTLQSNAENVGEILQGVEKQWEKRQKLADAAKLGLAIFETAVCIAAVALAGPVGAVGAAALVCGISGAINSGTSEFLDQWASGSAASEGYDLGQIALKGTIGGVQGAIKGAIGTSFAGLPKPSGYWTQAGMKLGTNLANTVVDEGFELVDAAVDGTWDEKWEEITSPECIPEIIGSCVIETAVDMSVEYGMKKGGDLLEKKFDGYDGLPKWGYDTGQDVVVSTISDSFTAGWEGFLTHDVDGNIKLDAKAAGDAALAEIADGKKYLTRTVTAGISNSTSALYNEDRAMDSEKRMAEVESRYQQEIDEKTEVLYVIDEYEYQSEIIEDSTTVTYVTYESHYHEEAVITPSDEEKMRIYEKHYNEVEEQAIKDDKAYLKATGKTASSLVPDWETERKQEYSFIDTANMRDVVTGKEAYVPQLEQQKGSGDLNAAAQVTQAEAADLKPEDIPGVRILKAEDTGEVLLT